MLTQSHRRDEVKGLGVLTMGTKLFNFMQRPLQLTSYFLY